MKNLLTKILFISLLSSAVIPSGIQASLFTEKFGRVALGAAVGVVTGTAVGVVAGTAVVLKLVSSLEELPKPNEEGLAIFLALLPEKILEVVPGTGVIGAVIGAGIGATGVELTLGSGGVVARGVVATGAGVGAVLGTIAGVATGLATVVLAVQSGIVAKKPTVALTTVVVTGAIGGAAGGAGVGAAMSRKIIAKYFS